MPRAKDKHEETRHNEDDATDPKRPSFAHVARHPRCHSYGKQPKACGSQRYYIHGMSTLPSKKEWLTAREAALHLRVSHRTILAWAKSGKLRGHVLSGTRRCTWRFLLSDLDATLHAPSAALDMEESKDAA
jgi:excisionase family DNA binding protein